MDPAAGYLEHQSGTYDDGYANIIRTNGAVFVILGTQGGDKAYVTCGANSNSDINFTWEYDFLTDTWEEKAPFKGTDRTGAVGFNVGEQGICDMRAECGRAGGLYGLRMNSSRTRYIIRMIDGMVKRY